MPSALNQGLLACCALWLPHAFAQTSAAAAASTPARAAAASAAVFAASGAAAATPTPRSAAQDASTSATLADLGLNLLRRLPEGQNAVLSPLSLANALGLVQAGAAGATGAEINRVLGAGSARQGQRFFAYRLPELHNRLGTGGPFTLANRLWVDEPLASSVQTRYISRIKERLGADGGVAAFAQPEQARTSINQWAAEQTAKQIQELLPAGSVSNSSRLVLTNAIHFKSRWDVPFHPVNTLARPFTLEDGQTVQVRTMQDEREVSWATLADATVLTLPFAGQDFSLLLAMPAKGSSVSGFVKTLRGGDLARWRSQLKPQRCTLSLPRFDLAATPRSLKASLQALGLRSAFSDRADFSPMLGQAAKGMKLESVYQSAAITLDETGGQASAATAAVIGLKSMAVPAPACAVDRPFVFALIHQASGTPLFVGQVLNPAQN